MKERVIAGGHADFKSMVRGASSDDFAAIRKHLKHSLKEDIYFFFQEACMEYFWKEYKDVDLPPGPEQDDAWSDAKFEAFCHAQLSTYGIDPVRLFLLKDAKLRQDTYRMAATLRRCELDIHECGRERVSVDKATRECLAELRGSVLLDAPSSSDPSPAFCSLWEQVHALRDGSKTDREQILQVCITEQQWASKPGAAPSDYRTALSDVASMANKLWVADESMLAAAQRRGLLPKQDIGAEFGELSADVEAQLAATTEKLASLRSRLDDAMIRCQLSGGRAQRAPRGDRAASSSGRALMETVQVVAARVTQNQDSLASLQAMRDSLMEAAAATTDSAASAREPGLIPNAQMLQKAVPAGELAAAKARFKRRIQLRVQLEQASSARPCVPRFVQCVAILGQQLAAVGWG
jgi:hypothetical protein